MGYYIGKATISVISKQAVADVVIYHIGIHVSIIIEIFKGRCPCLRRICQACCIAHLDKGSVSHVL